MTTGIDVVNAARLFMGEPYSTAPGRTSPSSGYKDCSGLVAAAYEVATGNQLGAYVSVTIYDLCAGTWDLGISREEAFGIPGACLLMPENPYQGWGSNGHIGFSDGVGGTVEATPPRVQALPNTYQSWGSKACLLPGIYYGPPLPPTPEPVASGRNDDMTIMWINYQGMNVYLVQAGIIVKQFHGAEGAFGIPQDAYDFEERTKCGMGGMDGDEWTRLLRRSGML